MNTATTWNAGYLVYDAAGLQTVSLFAGPEWQNLPVTHWYRFSTTVDFVQNRIVEVSIHDLTTGVTTTANPVGWFLGGGAKSVLPRPTGVRFFAGGAAGNIIGWDNLDIADNAATCPCNFNGDEVLNSQDFFDFLSCFFTPECLKADFNGDSVVNSQDFFDFLGCFFEPPAACD